MCRVGGFAHQVELVDYRLLVFGHYFEWFQSLAMFPVLRCESGDRAHDIEIALDLLLHAGTQDLDDDLRSVRQLGLVHLRNRCGRQRFAVQMLEYVVNRLAVGAFEYFHDLFAGERWDGVLELGEFIGDVAKHRRAQLRADPGSGQSR